MHVTSNVKEIANFIAMLNKQDEHCVGFCGTNEEEIADTLANEMDVDNYFVTMYEDGELIGVLGLDADEESKVAEIWGPFIKSEEWLNVATTMWQALLAKIPTKMSTFYGFYHNKNSRAEEFMNSLQFKRGNENLVLEVNKDEFKQGTYSHIVGELKGRTMDFIALHDACFPATYYDGKEIVGRLDEEKNVFLYVENDVVQGYVFVEADPEFHEGSIEFVGVLPEARGKGIGLQLTKRAIEYLFSFDGMKRIRLCVGRTNETAIRLYKKAGFIEKRQLVSFEKSYK
jgi:ribosomal protein S18 acetylase RimI-like enzyme